MPYKKTKIAYLIDSTNVKEHKKYELNQRQKNTVKRSSFKKAGIENYITPLLAVIANRNQAFSILHKGTHHERFVLSHRMSYILTYVRVVLATSDEQRILKIPATYEILLEDRNHGLV